MTIHEEIEKIFEKHGVTGFAAWLDPEEDDKPYATACPMSVPQFCTLVTAIIDNTVTEDCFPFRRG